MILSLLILSGKQPKLGRIARRLRQAEMLESQRGQ
jgi:hypothetical protein